jgi:hypothetical protein
VSEMLPETDNFGLTRVGAGESLAKNGYAALDLDRITEDLLHHAHEMHTHDGSPRLGNPSTGPTLSAAADGGQLTADTTYYYVVSYLDKWGLETAMSPEASLTTGAQIDEIDPPALTVETTGGTVVGGNYSYIVTAATDAGGETGRSTPSTATVTGGNTNRVRLDLPPLPTGTISYRIYRKRPGQTQFYYLDETDASPFYDEGNGEDCTITAPVSNSTNSTNSVTVTIPGGAIPAGVFGWKIYRATEPGGYDDNSLVHQVIEPTTQFGTDLMTAWVDTGDALQQGTPRNRSATLSGGKPIDLSQIVGSYPLATQPRGGRVITGYAGGALTNTRVITKTRIPMDIKPTALTASFGTGPTGLNTTDRVRIRVRDSQSTPNHVDIVMTAAAGYAVAEWPLTESGIIEAEDGNRSDSTAVPIASDTLASNGQVVELNANNEYVDIDLGVLDAGTYDVNVRMRSIVTLVSNDISISALVGGTFTLIETENVSVASAGGYADYLLANVVAPGAVNVVIRVKKVTATTNTVYVDKATFAAQLSVLKKGDITFEVLTDGVPTSAGSDVNVSLWF